MYILANGWFTTLIRQFFFSIDKIVFNFISQIYDLLITIARTSILSQADILDMAERIYSLLTVFMIFKVTLSLITYVVNPDDFSDKSKGVSKLGTNIIISLGLLILTPYIFNYAYQLQTIILEDNSLATLVFGDKGDDGFLTSAGDDMAFITMSPFFTPNVSIAELSECIDLTEKKDGKIVFNTKCSGLGEGPDYKTPDDVDDNSMLALINQKNSGADATDLQNYVAGIENNNLGLMFREEMVVAQNGKKGDYLMDYKFVFSTVVGVVVCLLLITFCMDVGIRSIKLAFLQLIAPVPILSYVDPKSGKDGLFKKWYSMCFKTYLSLFIRLLTIYFAVYIISLVADMQLVDIIDGSYVTNKLVAIFIIIGALMFAKQLPKILEGLGIKLDGDGKFTLNPMKKFEEGALGGKNITGAAAGAITGFLGNKGARRFTGAFGGLGRGLLEGKGYKEAQKHQADVNRKLRQARYDGKTFFGTMNERFGMTTGAETGSEIYERKSKEIESAHKFHQANLDYAKGLRTHILSELREKDARDLAGDTWRNQQQALLDAEAELQRANMSGDAGAIKTAKEHLIKTQDAAFKAIMDSREEDKYMTAEREKYNVRIENNRKYAEESGLTTQSTPMDSSAAKAIKDGSQKRVNETDMELYRYSQSSEASQHRGDKTAAEAKKIDVHFDA